MWYHAIVHYIEGIRGWYNLTKDQVIEEVLLPFMGKQVELTTLGGTPSLFNFGCSSHLIIIGTQERYKIQHKQNERGAWPEPPREFFDSNFLKEHNVTSELINELRLLSAHPFGRSLLEYSFLKPIDQLFVIMKFDDRYLDSAYNGVIKPLGEEFGLSVLRVDEIQDSGSINQQILQNIAISKLILAELSGERPNCYYEAGFAQALGKNVILTIRENEQIHFDLATYRFIRWSTENELRTKLRGRLEYFAAKERQP